MINGRKKQAVAVICGSANLYDFLWYYATYGKEYTWTAVAEYYATSDAELSKECERIGIFERVIFYDVNTKHMSDVRKIVEVAKAAAYYAVGKRDRYCQKLIAGCVDDYDLAVVPNSQDLLHGAFISQSSKKEIVILEDGGCTRTRTYHKWQPGNGEISFMYNLGGYLLSKMGYCDVVNRYELDTCRNCTKYAFAPEQIGHRTYKRVFQIHDNTYTDTELLDCLIKKWCGDFLPQGLCAEAVLYTMPMCATFENHEELKHRVEQYINENYTGKRVLLKKHLRDTYEYVFDDAVDVTEIPASIPAELMIDRINAGVYLFEFTSSVLNSYTDKKDLTKVFLFSGVRGKPYIRDYEATLKANFQIFRLNESQIIRL